MTKQVLPRLADGRVCYPRGWFVLGDSESLAVGEVKPLRYFGQDLVLYRSESGQPVVLDAYCPHLGAHLGHGGQVCGETLRCPFHAWRFAPDGDCVEVPYANRIPDRARIGSWPVRERNGLILVWHDHAERTPDFEIPELPEWGLPEWSGWHLQRLDIATHPREIIENVADKAHFQVVHRFEQIDDFQNVYQGHMATQVMRGSSAVGEIESRATYFGPAYQITWMNGLYDVRLLNAHTPIDENHLHLFFGVMVRERTDFSEEELDVVRSRMALFGLDPSTLVLDAEAVRASYVESTRQGYYDDVAIWEHKLFRPQPVYCDGDGPIARCRKWYAQFYDAA